MMSVKMEEDAEGDVNDDQKPDIRKREPISYEEPLSNVIEEITIDDSNEASEKDETGESDAEQVNEKLNTKKTHNFWSDPDLSFRMTSHSRRKRWRAAHRKSEVRLSSRE